MVLGTALLLVVAIARLLGGGSDASDGAAAENTAARTTPSGAPSDAGLSETAASETAAGQGKKAKKNKNKKNKPGKGASTSEAPVLAPPEGECAGSDVAITPVVDQAVAGRDVKVVLQMRTIQSPACTFAVSRDTITVSITSGKDAIWSSRDCPKAIPDQNVVVRNNVTTEVRLIWTQAKRSGEHCTAGTSWAMPGWYHVAAAALAGEPSDVQFELTTPAAATVTKTAKPKNQASGKPGDKSGDKTGDKPGKKSSGQPNKSPKKSPSKSPSGAVEPD
jgi:hypothetical protein